MAIRLTVLGCSGSFFDATTGVPCSSYLVQADGSRLLLDCGHGVYQGAKDQLQDVGLDAVVVSHTHGDHMGDLALIARDRALWSGRPVLIANSASVVSFLQSEDLPTGASVQEVADQIELELPGAHLSFSDTAHTVPTVACCVRDSDGHRLVYTADTGPGWIPPPHFKEPELLLIECTLAERTEKPAGKVHLAPEDVVTLAKGLHAQAVVITHVPPGEDAGQRSKAVQSGIEVPVASAYVGLVRDL